MSGRGRGRGGAANKVLLEKFGLEKGDLGNEPSVGPSETFPPLQFPKIRLKNLDLDTRNLNYMLAVKKDHLEYLRNSAFFITLDEKLPAIERYSDRYNCLNRRPKLNLYWPMFPRELWPDDYKKEIAEKERPKKRKLEPKSKGRNVKIKKPQDKNIEEKLEKLEKEETVGEIEGEKENEEGAIDELEEDHDEEMDEGTDYMNSYFDNGDDFIEDDGDPSEEGGVF